MAALRHCGLQTSESAHGTRSHCELTVGTSVGTHWRCALLFIAAPHTSTVAQHSSASRVTALAGAEPVDPLFLAFHVARDLQGKAIDGQVRLKADRPLAQRRTALPLQSLSVALSRSGRSGVPAAPLCAPAKVRERTARACLCAPLHADLHRCIAAGPKVQCRTLRAGALPFRRGTLTIALLRRREVPAVVGL